MVLSTEQPSLILVNDITGDLARIAPNILLTSDPDLVMRMSSARSKYVRSKWYAGQKFEVNHDNLFSTLDDNLHTKRRAQMAIGVSSFMTPLQSVLISKIVCWQRGRWIGIYG